jgi:glucokinase
MLLAGDVGGTKTLLGLFAPGDDRPEPIEVGEFVTLDYDGLEPMVREFLRVRSVEPRGIRAAAFGVAGAVTDQVARLTNVPWLVDAARVGDTLGLPLCVLLAQPEGNAAVIAAGTGLGEALLHNVDGRFVPAASEGGHADFAARTSREMDLVLELTRVFGRVGVEHVISGPGIVNIYQFTHQAFGTGPTITPNSIAPARLCTAVGPVKDPSDLPARISQSAAEFRCSRCVETMDIFVSAYGAEAGNLALRTVATAGVYVGGGIAPKILPMLEGGLFLDAFRAKEPMADLVAMIPVAVIVNPDAGLLGAAVHAEEVADRP